MIHGHSQFYTAILIFFILMAIGGCAATKGNYGKLIHSNDVTMAFEDYKVDPAYKYYYFGTKTFPKAVVGISKDFTMSPGLWEPIELTSKLLHSWIWVHANRNIKGYQDYGSNITGPNKEHIGIWYSLKGWNQWARITLTNEKSVKIGAPIDNQTSRQLRVLRI